KSGPNNAVCFRPLLRGDFLASLILPFLFGKERLDLRMATRLLRVIARLALLGAENAAIGLALQSLAVPFEDASGAIPFLRVIARVAPLGAENAAIGLALQSLAVPFEDASGAIPFLTLPTPQKRGILGRVRAGRHLIPLRRRRGHKLARPDLEI